MNDSGAAAGVDRAATVRRRIAVVLLLILDVAAAYFVAVSWLVGPDESVGDLAAAATATVGGGLALVTLLATAVPVGLRWIRAWWLAVPATLVVLAAVRLVLLP